ncbi:MAG: TetR/AcrR family transcriptional regulator [Pseudomonadales bacterium]|nr:TetR/AcrR family transcriptional regulator [Pseudomonadales bacterium]
MSRASLTPQEIEAGRSRVITAATELFAQDGFEAVTMRAIGREMGRSPTTPYTYFSNKEEIFAEVRTRAFARFADALEDGIRNMHNPLVRLRAMCGAYAGFARDNPDAYRLMFELRQGGMAEYPPLKLQRERSFGHPLGAARDAVSQGLLQGDPLTLAHTIWACCHGIVSLELAGQLDLGRSLDELVEPVTEAILRAYQTPSADHEIARQIPGETT